MLVNHLGNVHIAYTRLPRSIPNADQNPGIDLKYLSMPIIADQFLSIIFDSALISIDRNWSELIGINKQWLESIGIGINAAILIGIWAMIQESCLGL